MIVLEPCLIRRARRTKAHVSAEHYEAIGVRARRNGLLLLQGGNTHHRYWVSEARARKALERDWPGETILGVRGEAAE